MLNRITFNNICRDTCWQKQLRDRYLEEGPPPVPHLDLKRAVVRPVSRRLAQTVILRYEWLGTMASTRWHFGLFFGSYCAGVTCVAGMHCLAGVYLHRQFGIDERELLVLARGACVHWAPPGANSKLVSWTARLAKETTGAKLMMAFSDSDAGEIGTIYQACNWTYIGPSRIDPTGDFIAPSGRVVNQRILGVVAKDNGTDCGTARRLLEANGWRRQQSNPKHRYVMQLDRSDRALAERLAALSRPYPKRPRPEGIPAQVTA